MSERVAANAITFSLVAGYVIARIAYGGPDHATWLDILVVVGAALLGASTRLLNQAGGGGATSESVCKDDRWWEEEMTAENGWICAFVACGQPAGRPHLDGCPYQRTPSEQP